VVEAAICKAWEKVRTEFPDLIEREDEDHLTDQLKTELVRQRRMNMPAGFNYLVFGVPVRDAKMPSGSGNSIDTMPDLTIHLANPRLDVEDDKDALFFECKVIAPSKGLNLYDKNGIHRFVSGWYASSMPHAGMIAYIFDPRHACPLNSLTPYFNKKVHGGSQTNGERLLCKSSPTTAMLAPGPMAANIVETIHGRSFSGPSIVTPGDISLRHLWLLPEK